MKAFLVILGVLAVLVLVAWLGLQVPPRPLSPVSDGEDPAGETVALPQDLPPPVARFYETVYGSEVPRIETAVISGRARLTIQGITVPARFRFTHDAGADYRHHIEVTWFGLSVLTIHETFLDGRARLELPFGVVEDAPKVDEAANLGLWAEAVWFPAVYLTDPRVRWEAVDDATALLVVPQGDGEQRFVARFDPDTHLLRLLESMRYKNADDARRTLWLNDARAWGDVDGKVVPTEAALTWFDEGEPWAVFRTEEVVYGLAVEERLRERGP